MEKVYVFSSVWRIGEIRRSDKKQAILHFGRNSHYTVYTNKQESEDMSEKEDRKDKQDQPLTERMLETRSILISGEINKELAERVVRQLLLLDAQGKEPIKVFIDSPGGDADAGFAIYDMIRFVGPKVYTIGMGLVASAAAIVLLASPSKQRIALPNSHYLIHQPLSGIRGVATEIEIHARQLEKLRVKVNQLISSETGTALEKVEKDTDRDCWLDAPEAVEYGLVSEIITTMSELS
ncbi:MAG: ATP-dependent Clp protease proteolytic subunit [Spirochaetales bacterium]|nr:ATP-dependent Clp protease proteolytic subunit [Spirochaetales bacterium]